ncbi:hypothetical protein [Paractinoplanes toevensis]
MGGDTSADNEGVSGGESVAPVPYALGDATGPLERHELEPVDAWWRAANYLAVGQIYLQANPLLREHPDRSMRAASWVTRCCTRTVRFSTTRT